MWTRFMDMHSGGRQKLDWAYIYIEAPDDTAKVIFYNRFGRNPERVTCTCCGEDYSISEESSLEQATGYERCCDYVYFDKDNKEHSQDEWYKLPISERKDWEGRYVERKNTRYSFSTEYKTIEEYIKNEDVLVIYEKDIKDEERYGDVPEEGYVWK